MEDNYYQILGLDKNADENQIKKAYKKLAIKYHPDKNPNNKEAEEKFKTICEAYSILSDKDKKEQYDRFGKQGINSNFRCNTNVNPDEIFNSFFRSDPFNDFESNIFSNISNIRIRKCDENKIDIISNGTRVLIKDLINSKELNNCIGIVKGYDISKKKYLIRTCNKDIFIKDDNFIQLLNVTIHNLKSNSFLNGMKTNVIDYINGRYVVDLNRNRYSLTSENLIVDKNSKVKIINLKSNKSINGKWGLVLNFDSVSNRYIIKISNSLILKIKLENILF
jgi:curved DNA-binding protein CbpA